MRKLQTFLVIIFAICCYQTTFAQSCGGGNATFYVFDEDGIQEIKDFKISFHTVSENQNWQFEDAVKFGWKQQTVDEARLEKHENSKRKGGRLQLAYKISASEYSRLMKEREQILKKNPDSFIAKKIDRCNYYRKSSPINLNESFTICVSEGCNKMVVAEVQAEGYETAYFVDDFTCGCSKTYVFQLQRKRNKCLPNCEKTKIKLKPFDRI